MNIYFKPNDDENLMIQIIHKYLRNDFCLIRMTSTMLKKSIIDASGIFRKILKDNNVVDYKYIIQGREGKIIKKSILLCNDYIDKSISFYRPNTKEGDPRFWIYGLKDYLQTGDLIYITIWNSRVVIIPLVKILFSETIIETIFGKSDDEKILLEVKNKMTIIKEKGWIKSVGIKNGGNSPKDVGETLEHAMGIKTNNLISADYKGQIELKTKRISSKTNDTLFCLVPNWEISKVKSASDLILKYGYMSSKYKNYIDLYVTVSNKINNQGLYLGIDDENNIVFQNCYKDNYIEEVCKWKYDNLKKRLIIKHPRTIWVIAEEKIINNEKYFKYTKVQYTKNPIFTQFLYLIQEGIITYDWRGRVKIDSTQYRDKGHAFRIKPKNRNLLFDDTIELNF